MNHNKLKRPPHVPNWVRYNHPDTERTAKALVSFVKSAPQHTYEHALQLIHDMLARLLDPAQALTLARQRGRANSRALVEDLLQAFLESGDLERLAGVRVYDEIRERFRISRDISVPVRPVVTLLKDGRLKPIFVVGWKSVPLDRFQIRLMMTILEDALFSHTDFLDAEGEFLLYPQNSQGQREPMTWRRGDYDLLSSSELQEQMDVFIHALQQAEHILNVEGWRDPRDAAKSEARADASDPDQLHLDI